MKRKHYYLYVKSRGLAGIYIHIPYCKKACHYCNFHFSTTLKNSNEMVDAIIKEVSLRKGFLEEGIRTIYFGGGTPSILSPGKINRIVDEIARTFNTNDVEEITLEANPDDIKAENLLEWQKAGVNRISLGVQTFDNSALQRLNRSHTDKEALISIELLQDAGIENLTIDLMYGLSGQSLSAWENNLSKTVGLGIPHVSAYALTIEQGTVFGHQENKGSLKSLVDSDYEQQYNMMCDMLGANDYEHYEVSNFAKDGFRSLHNQLYWNGVPYLGLGPGAHSFNGCERQFNVSNNAKYIRSIGDGEIPMEVEHLSKEQRFNEYLLTGLRTSSGIDLKKIVEEFGVDLVKDHKSYFEQCVDNKLANFNETKFALTEKGFFLSDGIILQLMN